MTSWFKQHHSFIYDPKWDVVAARAGCSYRDVVSVFVAMQTLASEARVRGSIGSFRADVVAIGLRWDEASVAAVFEAMRGLVHDGRRLTGWDNRQASDEVERQRRQRERNSGTQSAKHAQTHESLRHAGVTVDSACHVDREIDREDYYETTPREAPNVKIPDEGDITALMQLLLVAGGAALDLASNRSQLHDLSAIYGLMGPGRGPPCDLAHHVIPAIRAKCATMPPGSIWSWAFFKRIIPEYRDACMAGAPAVVIPLHQETSHGGSSRRPARASIIPAVAAAAADAVARHERRH